MAFGVGAAQDVQRHAVLDAAGEVHVLAFGENSAATAAIFKIDSEQGGVSNQALKGAESSGDGRRNSGGRIKHRKRSL